MRVCFTGSRHWSRRFPVQKELRRLDPQEDVIVHGDAPGLDRMVGMLARKAGFRVERHPADWDRLGKAAGVIRNRQMLDSGLDLVLAFPLEDSVGTCDMVNIAREAGVTVRVHHHREGMIGD